MLDVNFNIVLSGLTLQHSGKVVAQVTLRMGVTVGHVQVDHRILLPVVGFVVNRKFLEQSLLSLEDGL